MDKDTADAAKLRELLDEPTLKELQDQIEEVDQKTESLKIAFGTHHGKTKQETDSRFEAVELKLQALSVVVKSLLDSERFKLQRQIRLGRRLQPPHVRVRPRVPPKAQGGSERP